MKHFLLILTILWLVVFIAAGIFVFSKPRHNIHNPFYAFGETDQETVIDLTYWGDNFLTPGEKKIFKSNSSNVVFSLGKSSLQLGTAFKHDLASYGTSPRFVFGKIQIFTNGECTFKKAIFPTDQAIALGIWGGLGLLIIIGWCFKRN